MSERLLTYAEAIREATDVCMAQDPAVTLIGEGVPDPKGIFGTTTGLRDKYGADRVSDMPVSENGLTGILIGAALCGIRPILTHQRVDFSVLSFDQLFNNAAKWHYMFGGRSSVPLTVRLIIGQGWGQGAQHAQNLHAMFSHVPGLKVVMPATPADAKGLLIAAVRDPNPVIYIEHRWLHGISGPVPEGDAAVPIGSSRIARSGKDLTLVASSWMTVQALKVSTLLAQCKVEAEVVDLRTLSPLDADTVLGSVRKTGRLLALDLGWRHCGYAAEVLARAAESLHGSLKSAPSRLTLPDEPAPSSPALARSYYPSLRTLLTEALRTAQHPYALAPQRWPEAVRAELDKADARPADAPDLSFKGPF